MEEIENKNNEIQASSTDTDKSNLKTEEYENINTLLKDEKSQIETELENQSKENSISAETELEKIVNQTDNIKIQSDGSAVKSKTDYGAQINKMNMLHLGFILFKLVIFCFAVILFVTIGQVFAFVAMGLIVMCLFTVWLAGTLITIGLIYVIVPGFSKLLEIAKDSSLYMEKIANFFTFLTKFLPVMLGVCIIGGIASILILSKTAPGKYKSRKVVLIVFISLSAILTMFALIALGGKL